MSDVDDRARWLWDRKKQTVYNGSFPVSADLCCDNSDSNRFLPLVADLQFHPQHSHFRQKNYTIIIITELTEDTFRLLPEVCPNMYHISQLLTTHCMCACKNVPGASEDK